MAKKKESDEIGHGCCFEQLQVNAITKGVSLKLDEQVHVGMLNTGSENSKMTRSQYNSISRAQTARFRTANLDLTCKDNEKPKDLVSANNILLSDFSLLGSKDLGVARHTRNRIVSSANSIAQLMRDT